MIFLFTEIDHPEVFGKRGTPDADHILSCQYFLIEEILYNHGVHWMKRTSKGVLGAFEGDGRDGDPPVPQEGGAGSPLQGPTPQIQGRPGEAVIALQKDFQSHLWGQFGKAKLKMALHAGEAEAAGQNYVGPEVSHALKVLEAARSGQTLLTVPAVHFIPLPPGSRLKDMGKHFLKDLTDPQNLFVLLHSDLEDGQDAPPLSLRDYPQNFFPQSSPFFGREEEMQEINGLLTQHQARLVTLVGPGGFGKTRLAFQSAAEAVDKFKDGVFIVALAPLLSDHLLIASLAHAVKFSFYGPEDPKTQLLGHLRDKQMLLVMDNFEHIIEGADLVREMMEAAPGLKILATSREKLGIEGEKVFEVKGLRYPQVENAAQMEASSAVQLFLKSARRLQSGFHLSPQDRGPLLDICRFLEGMPLGLELSATWVGTLSLPEIAGKIETSRDFLATSMPHLPPRHRSLRAVFEYSWILLTEAQKKALKAISVFRGGFTTDAVKKVAGAGEELLEKLSQKSLLRKRDGRYEVHELLKYYAKEKLFDDPAEKEKSLDAHCRYFSQWLQKKEKDLSGPRQKKVLDELAEEVENIREGWRRAVEKKMAGELEGYLEAYFAILETKGWLEEGRGAFREAAQSLEESVPSGKGALAAISLLLAKLLCRWADFERNLGNNSKAGELLKESLARLKGASAAAEAGKTLGGLGQVMETEGKTHAAKSYFVESLKAFLRAKDRHGAALALNQLGHMESVAGNFKAAQALIRRSLAYSEKAGDQRSMGHSYNLMGDMLHELSRREESKAYYQKGLAAYLESGDRRGMSWSFINLGRVAEGMGDFTGARQMIHEGLAIVRDLHDPRGEAWCENLLGNLDWATGDYKEAHRHYGGALALYRQVGDKRGEAWTVDLIGNLELAEGEHGEAEKNYRQAHDLLAQEGLDRRNKAWHTYHLGALAISRERYGEAGQYFREALGLFKLLDDGLGQVACLIQLGETALGLKEPGRALSPFRQAGTLALRLRLTPFLPDLLVGIARFLKAQGDENQAVGFVLAALSHPTCRRQTKDRVVAFSMDLQSHFSPEEVEGARQWAKASRIEDVVGAWVSGKAPAEKGGKTSRRKAAPKPRRPSVKRKRPSSRRPPQGRRRK